MQEQLESIERLVAAIEASPARSAEAIRQRLKEQIGRLLEAGGGLFGAVGDDDLAGVDRVADPHPATVMN